MNHCNSLSGMVEAELVSAEIAAAITAINDAGIEIRRIQWIDELTCRFQLRYKNLALLEQLVNKRGETLHLYRYQGLQWKLISLIKRPILISGLLGILLLSLILPEWILFLRVEGNTLVADSQILEAAENAGLSFGSSRQDLRSERIKNEILHQLPALQWAGVNTYGCTAVISVKEGSAVERSSDWEGPTRIVASRDGFVISGTVEQGTGLFHPGQTVQRGQLLISGYVDCGYCVRQVEAAGDIVAQTKRNLTSVMPISRIRCQSTPRVKYGISFLLRKKRINLWKDSGISDSTCDRMYKEYYITLPGGFQLPFAVCVDTFTFRDTAIDDLPGSDAESYLRDFSQQYIQDQMIAGTIEDYSERFLEKDGCAVLLGEYICTEMIGRVEPEQIGVLHGKNN